MDKETIGIISNERRMDYCFSDFMYKRVRGENKEGEKLGKFKAHSNSECNDAVFRNEILFTCGRDGCVNLFDLTNQSKKKIHTFTSKFIVNTLCVNDSCTLIGSGTARSFDLHSLETQKLLTNIPSEKMIDSCASKTDIMMLFSSIDGIYSLDTRDMKTEQIIKLNDEDPSISSIKVLSSSDHFVVLGDCHGSIKIVDDRKNWESILEIPKFAEDFKTIKEIIEIRSNEKDLICVSNTSRIFIYDYVNGKCHGCFLPSQTTDCVLYFQ